MAALFLALLRYSIFICFTELSWPVTTQDYSLTLLERVFGHVFEGKELGGLSKRSREAIQRHEILQVELRRPLNRKIQFEVTHRVKLV